jgi:PAS domain S-box-containing protein/putative nucleotidyltransferase with HDIG domain
MIAKKYGHPGYAGLVETVREPLLLLDGEFKVLLANRSFYELFKVTPKETAGKLIYALGNGDWDIPQLRTLLEDILEKTDAFEDYEIELAFSGIGRKRLMLNARRISRGERDPELILLSLEDVGDQRRFEGAGVSPDIAERHKKADELLRESEKRYRSLFENMLEGFAYCEMLFEGGRPQDFVYLAVNNAFEKLTGLKNVVGKKVSEVIPGIKESNPELFEIYGRVAMTGKQERFEIHSELFGGWLSISVYSPGKGYFVAVFDNITECKRTENELKLFRSLIDQANDAINVVDPETGCFFDVNAKSCLSLGYEREELLKMCVQDVEAVITDASLWKKHVDEVKKKGHVVLESRHRRKDGSTFPVEVNISYISLGKKDYMVAVARDVTERKQAEEERRKSEKKYKDLFDSTLDGIYQVDADGFFVMMNPAGARIFGYERPEEIIGRNALEYWRDPGDRDAFRAELKSRKSVSGYHMRARNKNGRPLELESSSLLREDEKGDFLGIEGILRDVTERMRADERIDRQIQKLSALRSIDLAISSSLDIRLTLKVFLEQVVTQLHVDACDVLLLNPHAKTLDYAASQGFRTSALRHTHLRLGQGYAGIAALENRVVSIPNVKRDDSDFKRLGVLEGEDVVTYFGVPLVAKGQVKGVLEIFHRSTLEPDEEWLEFLEALALQAAIAIDNNALFQELERSNMGLALAYDSTIEGWSRALDYRDKETEGHSQRVTDMTIKIAREMGMNEVELMHVRWGTLLHDIGKMGIPDNILLKPDALTEEEWKIMRLHPVYAYELLHPIGYLRSALDVPYCHHEKWDGTGYPRGLKGEQIPLSARIFAAVDVWDALRSDRPYRPAWPKEKTVEHIRQLAGTHFDPKVVEVFLRFITAGIL